MAGVARHGPVGRGKAGQGTAWYGRHGRAWLGAARYGWPGAAGHGSAGRG